MTSPGEVTQPRLVVDTDVVSFVFKQHTRADFFRPFFMGRTLAVSFMTVAELYFGAYKGRWGARQMERLEYHLRNYVVVPYDHRLTQEWARVRVEQQEKGRTMGHADAWIAATARLHNCALATNNARDFMGIAGLVMLSPSMGET